MNDFINQTAIDFDLPYNIVESLYNKSIKANKYSEDKPHWVKGHLKFYELLEQELSLHTG